MSRPGIALRIALVMSVVAVFVGIVVCAAVMVVQCSDAERETRLLPSGRVPTVVERDGVAGRTPGTAADVPAKADRERSNLLLAFWVAESVALPLGAVTSGMVAWRATTPLYEVLDRQRRFVVDASHELRAPLTQLHTRAQLLARRAETEPPRQLAADLQRLVSGTRQLGEIVEDVLLSAQSSQSPRSREPVDLAQLAKEAVAAEDSRAQG